MRFGMAALLVLVVGAGGAAEASPLPAPAALPAAACAAPVASLVIARPALAGAVGDIIVPGIVDFSFRVAMSIMEMIETVTYFVDAGLKQARGRGDMKAPRAPDPTLSTPALLTQGPPSPRLEP